MPMKTKVRVGTQCPSWLLQTLKRYKHNDSDRKDHDSSSNNPRRHQSRARQVMPGVALGLKTLKQYNYNDTDGNHRKSDKAHKDQSRCRYAMLCVAPGLKTLKSCNCNANTPPTTTNISSATANNRKTRLRVDIQSPLWLVNRRPQHAATTRTIAAANMTRA